MLDTEADPEFNGLTALAKSVAGVETALVSLIDQDGRWIKGRAGPDAVEPPPDAGFCAHAMLRNELLWVENAAEDPRFRDIPLVMGPPHVRFYAGAPLTAAGQRVGTLCVLDSRPRAFDARLADQLRRLADLTQQRLAERRFRLLSSNIIETSTDAVVSAGADHRITYWSPAAERLFGHTAVEAVGRSLSVIVPDRFRSLHEAGFNKLMGGANAKLVGRTVEIPGLHKNGREFPIELSLSAWRDGASMQVGAIIRDCTERKSREGEARAAENKAREAEAAASVSLDRLRAVLEAVPGAMAFYDAEDRCILWNTRYAKLHPECGGLLTPGTTFQDLLRAALARGVHPEAWGREDEWFQQRVAIRARGGGEHEQLTSDGRWVRVEERRTPDGGCISLCTDITDLKRRAASFELLFERNPAAMWVVDLETQAFLSVNEAAVRVFGHPREAFTRLRLQDLIQPEERARLELLAASHFMSFEDGEVWAGRTADGGALKIRVAAQELEVEGRRTVLAALFDVTAQLQATDDLNRTKTFLDAVVESVPAMLVAKDARDGRFVLLNRAGEDVLGMDRSAFLGRTDHDLFPAEQADFFVARDREVLSQGGTLVIQDEPVTTARGVRRLQTKKLALPGPDGEPAFLLAVAEDITERKAAAEALRAALESAQAANRAKDEFLANMSHEMRTPLNGVVGLSHMLAQTALTASQKELLELIGASATVLDRLLSDVLDVSRIAAGRLAPIKQPFHLGDAVEGVTRVFQLKAAEKGLSVKLTLAPECRVRVVGDDLRFKQMLGNLLSNAVKFTQAGEVAVTTRLNTERAVVVQVRDTGIGFAPEVGESIFERFKQAEADTTRRFGGAGLGLSISRDLAELMGGTLTAEGRPGEGAAFTLTLPLPAAEPAALSAAATAQEGPPPLRVLLAEDNPTNRRVIALIVQSIGASLVTAENGLEAVQAYAPGAFDVILMDLQMPVMDGLTAIRRIRAAEADAGAPRTPVVVVSANADRDDRRASFEAGADDHLGKPITPPALIEALMRLLEAPGEAGDPPWAEQAA